MGNKNPFADWANKSDEEVHRIVQKMQDDFDNGKGTKRKVSRMKETLTKASVASFVPRDNTSKVVKINRGNSWGN